MPSFTFADGENLSSIRNRLIGAIDQGTSSSKFLLFSVETGELVAHHQIEIKKLYPYEGWVEQDPLEIYQSVIKCIEVVAKKLHDSPSSFSIADIFCIGLTNQRESTILWERTTGKPLYNSIVWLDNRTSDLVKKIKDHLSELDMNWIKCKTGLPISTYFSALKIKWLIENVPEVQVALSEGNLMFGTIDSWLLWNLTGNHLTDVTNASRTSLMDLETLQWDPWLCDFFKIPMSILPEIRSSSDMFGEIKHGPLTSIPITGVIGDQSAALVGQKCLSIGQIKVTYGTGAFLVENIGPGPLNIAYKNVSEKARHKLLTTVAFKLGNETAWYALEGSISIAGEALTWLRDNLEVINNYEEVENLARMDSSSGGLYFVPAFQGLYAPYWDSSATGLIIGISQFSRKCHLIRATLEGIAYQTNDILCLMCNGPQYGIRVDGGMSSNDLFCQMLADITGNTILRARMIELTAFGAAMIASYHYGLWEQFLNAKPTSDANKIDMVIKPTKICHLPNYHNNDIKRINNNQSTVQVVNNDVTNSLVTRYDSKFDYFKQQLFSLFIPSKSRTLPTSEPITEDIKRQYDIFKQELDETSRIDRVNNWREAVHRSRKWNQVKKKQKRVLYFFSTLPITFFIISSFWLCIISRRFN